jgi:hypothetical protein
VQVIEHEKQAAELEAKTQAMREMQADLTPGETGKNLAGDQLKKIYRCGTSPEWVAIWTPKRFYRRQQNQGESNNARGVRQGPGRRPTQSDSQLW